MLGKGVFEALEIIFLWQFLKNPLILKSLPKNLLLATLFTIYIHKELERRKKHLGKRISRVGGIIFYDMKSPCAGPLQSSFFHRPLDTLIQQDNLESVGKQISSNVSHIKQCYLN